MTVTEDALIVEEEAPAQKPVPETEVPVAEEPSSQALDVVDDTADIVRQIEHPEAKIMRQAQVLADSTIIPAQFRKKPDDIVAAGLMGLSYGLDLMQSLRSIFVVDGKPTMAAEAMVALVRKRGHSITGSRSSERVTVKGIRADNGDEMEVTWTIDDAHRAKLTSKSNWKSYPAAMLWARATSDLCRSLFSDVTGGLYVYEELGDATVEVLDTKPVGVLNVETGEVEAMIQPSPPNHANPTMINEALRKFGMAPADKQEALKGWMKNFKHNGEPCGWEITVESLPTVPGDVVAKLIGLCDKAIDAWNAENRAPDTPVDEVLLPKKDPLYEELQPIHDGLSDAEREVFEAWCMENKLNPFSRRLGVPALTRMAVWLRAHAGMEPFEVDPPADAAEEAPDGE